MPTHVGEHVAETRDNKEHQESQNRDCDEHHDNRVNHRRDNFPFQLMGFLLVFSETLEHHFEDTTKFTGFHHVHKELVENLWMLPQRFGKGRSSLHGFGKLIDGRLENQIRLLLTQHRQSTEKWET